MENTKNTRSVKRTERGWAGHYCRADVCLFRRNTLLELNDIKIVVSTVGAKKDTYNWCFDEVGIGRFYETMCFYSKENNDPWHDANVEREISFESNWKIKEVGENSNKKANDMHEAVVTEITDNLTQGCYAEY